MKSEATYSDDVDEGDVISTDPVAGTKLKEGDTVTMKVSMGAEKAEVPSLTGKSESEAQSLLAQAGLEVGNVSSKYSDSVAEGCIISQGTKAGKKVSKGTSVDYVVSKGPQTKMVTVPTLTGKTGDEAAVALQNAGLNVGSVTYEYSNTVSVGYVISQSASPGSQMEEGASVSYVISNGREEPDTDDTESQSE